MKTDWMGLRWGGVGGTGWGLGRGVGGGREKRGVQVKELEEVMHLSGLPARGVGVPLKCLAVYLTGLSASQSRSLRRL